MTAMTKSEAALERVRFAAAAFAAAMGGMVADRQRGEGSTAVDPMRKYREKHDEELEAYGDARAVEAEIAARKDQQTIIENLAHLRMYPDEGCDEDEYVFVLSLSAIEDAGEKAIADAEQRKRAMP